MDITAPNGECGAIFSRTLRHLLHLTVSHVAAELWWSDFNFTDSVNIVWIRFNSCVGTTYRRRFSSLSLHTSHTQVSDRYIKGSLLALSGGNVCARWRHAPPTQHRCTLHASLLLLLLTIQPMLLTQDRPKPVHSQGSGENRMWGHRRTRFGRFTTNHRSAATCARSSGVLSMCFTLLFTASVHKV